MSESLGEMAQRHAEELATVAGDDVRPTIILADSEDENA